MSIENKNHEQGRSMVEMLGTLAIIGVLSIGGLAAYSYGMTKYRTNELLEGASRRAYTVAAQVAMNRTPSLVEFENDTNAGGTFGAVKPLGEEFGLKVTGVSEEVCKNLIKISSESTIIQDITTAEDENTLFTEADCSGDNNSFMIIYNNNMGSGDTTTTVTCEEDEKVTKIYYEGDCCEQQKTGKFCPTENPPRCIVAESKFSQCKTDCDSEGYNWDSVNNICCVDGGGITDECCKMEGGAGLSNNGDCCEYNIDANGECCADAVDPDGNCCEIADYSPYCCTYWQGTWDGSSCNF